MLKEANQKLF